MGYILRNGIYWGYSPRTGLLLTSWVNQVELIEPTRLFSPCFHRNTCIKNTKNKKNTQQKHTNLLNNASSFFGAILFIIHLPSAKIHLSSINPSQLNHLKPLKKLTLQGTYPHPTLGSSENPSSTSKSGGCAWDMLLSRRFKKTYKNI